jgi:transposase InsO family protein
MILVEDRQMTAERIVQAQRKGARLKAACGLAGIDVRTLQRWKREGLQHGDRRPHAIRPTPAHALSAHERERIVQIANESRFAELPPARIVPMLADEGIYLANWDLTFLASKVVGQWFYLYLIPDVYSRKIVGFEVRESDSSDHGWICCVGRRCRRTYTPCRKSPSFTGTMARRSKPRPCWQ